jgi:hypothetical protein
METNTILQHTSINEVNKQHFEDMLRISQLLSELPITSITSATCVVIDILISALGAGTAMPLFTKY